MHFLALLGFMLNLTSVEHSSYKNYCIVSYENSLLKKKIPGVLILSPFPWLLVFRTGESPAGLLGSWSSILHVTPNTSVAALLSAGSLRAGPHPGQGRSRCVGGVPCAKHDPEAGRRLLTASPLPGGLGCPGVTDDLAS